jgi:hypothetical protein
MAVSAVMQMSAVSFMAKARSVVSAAMYVDSGGGKGFCSEN